MRARTKEYNTCISLRTCRTCLYTCIYMRVNARARARSCVLVYVCLYIYMCTCKREKLHAAPCASLSGSYRGYDYHAHSLFLRFHSMPPCFSVAAYVNVYRSSTAPNRCYSFRSRTLTNKHTYRL